MSEAVSRLGQVDAARPSLSRRDFLRAAAVVVPVIVAGKAGAQETLPGATMAGDGYIPVRREPKPNAAPSMTNAERDVLERRLACPCPCTMDIFTCRTSMPSCGFSPRIHRDVVMLVEGGYSADEIMAAFEGAYGEFILMAPPKRGFNLVGWMAPFVALLVGAIAVLFLIRSWRRPAAAGVPADVTPLRVQATDEELARLEAAVRGEEP